MNRTWTLEAERIDRLLDELAEREQQDAAAADSREGAGSWNDETGRFVRALWRETEPERQIATQASRRVMEAIPSLGGDAKLMRQIDAAMQEAAFAAKARASRRFGVLPHFTARQAIRIAAAALAIVLCSILVWRLRSQTARAEVAYGEVFVSTGVGIEQPLGPGERFRLPAWVRAGSEARLEIQPGPVAHLAANTRVRIESSREAAQMNGLARYAIRSNGRADGEEPAFTVITPLGRVDDLGTEFEIDLRESGIARIRVDQGMVRAQPNEGPSLDISAGRAARMGLRLAILENEPAD